MRKKLLTVALAATMAVSSVFSAFATELSGAWWTAWSESYEIADGATLEFDIDVKGGDAVWNNVAAVFTNSKISGTQAPADEAGASYKEYAVVRGDNWGWGGGDNKSSAGSDITYEGGIADLGDTDFIATMKDCHLDITITRNGNDITMVTKGTGTNGKTFTRTAKFTDDLSAGVNVFFVPDTSTITVSKADAAAPVDDKKDDTTTPTTTAPTDGKGNDDKAPDTGDTAAVAVVAIVALGAAVAVVASKKKVTE